MKLVILDRDGTINHDSEAYIKSPAEWTPLTALRLAELGLESGLPEGLFQVLPGRVTLQRADVLADHDVLVDGQVVVEVQSLERPPDAGLGPTVWGQPVETSSNVAPAGIQPDAVTAKLEPMVEQFAAEPSSATPA